jgi:hypothetical protein
MWNQWGIPPFELSGRGKPPSFFMEEGIFGSNGGTVKNGEMENKEKFGTC